MVVITQLTGHICNRRSSPLSRLLMPLFSRRFTVLPLVRPSSGMLIRCRMIMFLLLMLHLTLHQLSLRLARQSVGQRSTT